MQFQIVVRQRSTTVVANDKLRLRKTIAFVAWVLLTGKPSSNLCLINFNRPQTYRTLKTPEVIIGKFSHPLFSLFWSTLIRIGGGDGRSAAAAAADSDDEDDDDDDYDDSEDGID